VSNCFAGTSSCLEPADPMPEAVAFSRALFISGFRVTEGSSDISQGTRLYLGLYLCCISVLFSFVGFPNPSSLLSAKSHWFPSSGMDVVMYQDVRV
jgi:hypothetical protein